MKLGEKILRLRKARNMSQEELASTIGVSRQAVSRWEMGAALPDAGNVLQLSKLFGVTADYLLDDDYKKEEAAAVPQQVGKQRKWPARRIAGICMAVAGLAANLAIYVASRFIEVMVPVKNYGADGKLWYTWSGDFTGYSYKYFVQHYNLEFLTILFWLLVLGGLVLAFYNREKLAALREKRQQRRRERKEKKA